MRQSRRPYSPGRGGPSCNSPKDCQTQEEATQCNGAGNTWINGTCESGGDGGETYNDGDSGGEDKNWAWGVLSGGGHAVEDFVSGGNKQTEADFAGINAWFHSVMVNENVDQSSMDYSTGYITGYVGANLAPSVLGDPEAGAGALFDGSLEDGGLGASRLAAACGGESFTADTMVLTASGESVPISGLHVGEKIASANTATGKNQVETIAAVLVHFDTDLYDLTIDTPRGTQTIHTTANHLIWNITTKSWVEASKLHKGDRLRTDDGAIATVDGGKPSNDSAGWMWDLTVDTLHDFYVVAGDTPVLVHNSSCLASAANDYPGIAHTLDEHVGLTPQQAIAQAAGKSVE